MLPFLESVFLFWGLVFIFGFCGLHFPYRPRYIFDRRISVNLYTGGNSTRLSISWQFRQEKGSIISEFKQVCTYVSAVFCFYYSLVQLKVNLWLRQVDDSQSTGDTPLYQPYRSVCAAIKGLGFCAVFIGVRAGGARGAAAPPNFGRLRFFGQQEKIWAKPVFKDVSMFFLLL